MFYEPKKGHPFSIDPYKSLIFPRPIGWISTISKKGIPNLAPYSYFNAVADHPPQVMFSEEASISSNKYKDTLTNILSTKEFVVNFTSLKKTQKKNNTNTKTHHRPQHTTLHKPQHKISHKPHQVQIPLAQALLTTTLIITLTAFLTLNPHMPALATPTLVTLTGATLAS